MSKYYITTPIYYVNDVPHIGHAYTTLLSDVIARFMRLDGHEVKFLTGTDEHGQKIEKSSKEKGVDIMDFVDENSDKFRNLFGVMNISNDDFIRTTEERHKKAATHLWEVLLKNGHIYKDKYAGWYSVRDEAYYAEDELIDGGKNAPTGAPVEWVEEESYFFDLSKWQDKLLEFYDSNPDFIKPASKRNEVISFVKGGLHDLSVSRTTMKWGIGVPGDDNHVMYVWLDALTNYLSSLGYPDQNAEEMKFWPCDLHMIGKDILRFHAVYWPAFLMAADIAPPKRVFAHGWWTNEGVKISKSLGNVIDPIKIIDQYGLDYVRYFLAREVIIGNDGDFSHASFVAKINSELANKIGNLCQRTLAFINKNLDSTLPEVSDLDDLLKKESLTTLSYQTVSRMRVHIKDQEINHILDLIVRLSEEANMFIDREAPWTLKKTDEKRMNEVLMILCEAIRLIAIYLLPFVPDSATKILDQLGAPTDKRDFSCASFEYALKPGHKINQASPVFGRLV